MLATRLLSVMSCGIADAATSVRESESNRGRRALTATPMRVGGPLLRAVCGSAVAAVLLAAQTVPSSAAIYSQQQALPAAAIAQFLADPLVLLVEFPNGGPQMIAKVRDFAASDPATLNPIVGLLGKANTGQATAIGTGLGQVALMAVKTDQAYANDIQQAIAAADPSAGVPAPANGAPSQHRIGNAVTTKDQVDGVTPEGTHPIIEGTNVYLNELVLTGASGMAQFLFADHTNLSVGPVTEIKLDSFVYNPNAKDGNVVVVASQGAFRFITGLQHSENYSIKTPFATLGVRGTEFIVLMNGNEEKIQLNHGKVIVTTISHKEVTMDTPDTVLSVDSNGNTQGPSPSSQPLVNFAALGSPVTHFASSDAFAAFAAATGNSGIGSTGSTGGGGGGGGGEAQTGDNGNFGGRFGFGNPLDLTTTSNNPPPSGPFGGNPISFQGGGGFVSPTSP